MSKMVQIRDVPDRVHGVLKARAALAGLSLSDYLLHELERFVEHPTLEEMRARLAARRPADLPHSTAAWVREERDG